jgi:F0F1-type ATP synthase assembly protein I
MSTERKPDVKRGEMSFIFAIIIGLAVGLFIKRVRIGLLIGLVLGLVIVFLGALRSSRK